ncbi:MAG: hypothetical protein M5U15_13940 [Kiritimatiellae bacterium]|nr:hypothetical protein [Kiritimatiellia bacterium]
MPAKPWNYAIVAPKLGIQPRFEWIEQAVGANPWDPDQTPYRVFLSARTIPGWKLERFKKLEYEREGKKQYKKGNFAFTPKLPSSDALSRASKRAHTIEIVPYGATRLRLAVLPRARQ